ncbi:MAG: hypothetical protein RLZ97_2003 [Verrucomicrobiota bacterium]|jgi:hypothetical protein
MIIKHFEPRTVVQLLGLISFLLLVSNEVYAESEEPELPAELKQAFNDSDLIYLASPKGDAIVFLKGKALLASRSAKGVRHAMAVTAKTSEPVLFAKRTTQMKFQYFVIRDGEVVSESGRFKIEAVLSYFEVSKRLVPDIFLRSNPRKNAQ